MRSFLRKIILLFIISLFSGLIFLGYSYGIDNLRLYLTEAVEQNFNLKLSIGRVGIGFPVSVELADLEVNNFIEISNIYAYPNPISFLLKNKLIISRINIIDPVIKIKGNHNFFISAADTKGMDIYFSSICIKNGKLIYERENSNSLEMVGINATLERPGLYFSRRSGLRFVMSGFLKNINSYFLSPLKIEGSIEPDGIIKLRLRSEDMEPRMLGPICERYLISVLEKAQIDIRSNMVITKTELKAKCFLKCDDFIAKKGFENKIDTPLIARFILLVNFKDSIIKIRGLKSNLFNLIAKST